VYSNLESDSASFSRSRVSLLTGLINTRNTTLHIHNIHYQTADQQTDNAPYIDENDKSLYFDKYEDVSKSFRTGRQERELPMDTADIWCSFIAILWVSPVSFAAITLCVASQRVTPKVSVYFVIDSIRKLLDTPSYIPFWNTFPMTIQNLHVTHI
jgi:hypothetical protein